jgi:hypothetical protein
MSIYDPPLPPEPPTCKFCDAELEKEGYWRGAEWVCTNPHCEHSINYQESEEE